MNQLNGIIGDLKPLLGLLAFGASAYLLGWALIKRPPKDSYEAAWLAIGFLAFTWVIR
jgi:hypothetical protein